MADEIKTTGHKHIILKSVVLSVGIVIIIAWYLMWKNRKNPVTTVTVDSSTFSYDVLDTDSNIVFVNKDTGNGSKYPNYNGTHTVEFNLPTMASNPKANLYNNRTLYIYNLSQYLFFNSGDDVIQLNTMESDTPPTYDLQPFNFIKFIYSKDLDKWYTITIDNLT